jgi:hypothetical protein
VNLNLSNGLFNVQFFYIFVDFKYWNNAAVEIGEITGE